MLDILRRQLETGYANRNDVAVQEAALAQVEATLPPLRKALQQNRDLLVGPCRRLSQRGAARNIQARGSAPAGRSAGEPAVATHRAAAGRARGARAVALGERADRRRHRQYAAEFHDQRQCRLHEYCAGRLAVPQNSSGCLPAMPRRQYSTPAPCCTSYRKRKILINAAAWSYRGTVVAAVQNVTDSLRALQNDADALKAARDSNAPPRSASISPASRCNRQRQRADPAQRAADLSAGGNSGGAGARRAAGPTRRRFIRRLAAAGGTASNLCPRKCSTSARGKPNRRLIKTGATDFCAAFGFGLTNPIDRLNFALATTRGRHGSPEHRERQPPRARTRLARFFWLHRLRQAARRNRSTLDSAGSIELSIKSRRQRSASRLQRRSALSGTARLLRSARYLSSVCASFRRTPPDRAAPTTGITLIEVSPLVVLPASMCAQTHMNARRSSARSHKAGIVMQDGDESKSRPTS